MAHLGATLVTPPAPFPSWRAAVGVMAMPEGGLKVDREQKETPPAEPPAAPAAGSAHPGPRKHPAEPSPARGHPQPCPGGGRRAPRGIGGRRRLPSRRLLP